MDYLKLPTIVKTGNSTWQTGSLSLNIQDALKMRSKIILKVFREFKPEAVLIDHMPVGALGELKRVFDSSSWRSQRPRLFLGIRDILDTPEVVRDTWTKLGAYEYLRQYDAVLVYGCRNMYAADSAYRLSPYANKVVYCNYVGASTESDLPLHADGEPFVLVMVGGGGDGFGLEKIFVDALPNLLKRAPLQAFILTGPNMPRSDREVLLARSSQYPVQVLGSYEDATPWLRRAAAVVTMAGYNSLCEVMAWRKKALVIPRGGPSAEQRTRGQIFSRERIVRMVSPDVVTPRLLARELTSLLTDDEVPNLANIPPLDGAQRAATLLLDA
jgi:predicted glycosyltransferase